MHCAVRHHGAARCISAPTNQRDDTCVAYFVADVRSVRCDRTTNLGQKLCLEFDLVRLQCGLRRLAGYNNSAGRRTILT